jgi:DNA helicase-2/ATP-dependent DNA helicase PcrA
MSFIDTDKWRPRGVDSLEPTADQVVRSTNNTLVIAGPGAGKTELLAQRACFLLECGVCRHPRRILAISFKRDAARNLSERVEKRCGDLARRFDSMTLDAFGKSLVDRFRAGLPADWRPLAGYEVMVKSPTIREIREWFESIPIPADLQQVQFNQMPDDQLKRNFELCVYGVPLPYDEKSIHALVCHFGLRWWRGRISQPAGQPSLMFAMLSRLAAYLLRCNPTLLKALRATYSHVFMDEYQDTTAAQYDLVRSAFLGSKSILTAVGDSKQRIMVWAGAIKNAFELFTADFSAENHHLVRNYRSAPELVRIQDTIAQAIESETPPVEPAQRNVTDGVCFVAEFNSPEQEASYLADLITFEISQQRLKPRDMCILARQKAGEMVTILQKKLRDRDVRLRDESELQDLLAEPVSELVLSVLRLATRVRDPDAWEYLNHELALLGGLDSADEGDAIASEASAIIRFAKDEAARVGSSLKDLPALVVKQIGEQRLRAAYRQYSNAIFLANCLSRLGELLVNTQTPTLKAAVDELIGNDIIPAMTVHKSKGLEFHTVVFLGLEDAQLWSFAKQSDEEKRGFFVAFSRAITRVIFTFSDVRDGKFGRKPQKRDAISNLYSLLQAAGVETRDLRSHRTQTEVT